MFLLFGLLMSLIRKFQKKSKLDKSDLSKLKPVLYKPEIVRVRLRNGVKTKRKSRKERRMKNSVAPAIRNEFTKKNKLKAKTVNPGKTSFSRSASGTDGVSMNNEQNKEMGKQWFNPYLVENPVNI